MLLARSPGGGNLASGLQVSWRVGSSCSVRYQLG